MILALQFSLLREANLFKKVISLSILSALFLYCLFDCDEMIKLAPLLIVFAINLFPSLFFPLMAKNKSFFFTALESITMFLNL